MVAIKEIFQECNEWTYMQRGSRFWKLGALCLPIILLYSCSDSGQNEGSAAAVAAPARVSVMTVKPETVPCMTSCRKGRGLSHGGD